MSNNEDYLPDTHDEDTQGDLDSRDVDREEPVVDEAGEGEVVENETTEELLRKLRAENEKLKERIRNKDSFIGKRTDEMTQAQREAEALRNKLAQMQVNEPRPMTQEELDEFFDKSLQRYETAGDQNAERKAELATKREMDYRLKQHQDYERSRDAMQTRQYQLEQQAIRERIQQSPIMQVVNEGDVSEMMMLLAREDISYSDLADLAGYAAVGKKTLSGTLEQRRMEAARNSARTSAADAASGMVGQPDGGRVSKQKSDKPTFYRDPHTGRVHTTQKWKPPKGSM